jgi:hypothetical protein
MGKFIFATGCCLALAGCHLSIGGSGDGSRIGVAVQSSGVIPSDKTITFSTSMPADNNISIDFPAVSAGSSQNEAQSTTGSWTVNSSVTVTPTATPNCTITPASAIVTSPQATCDYSNGAWSSASCGVTFTISCTAAVKAAAKNAVQAVSISVKPEHKNRSSIKAIAPISLTSSNAYKSKMTLTDVPYTIQVSPQLDKRDYVAKYPASLAAGATSLNINYVPTTKYMLTAVPYSAINIPSLQDEHYNAAYITGLSYHDHEFFNKNSQVDVATVSSALTADFSAFIKLAPEDLQAPGLLTALPKAAGIVLDLSRDQSSKALDSLLSLHARVPAMPIAVIAPSTVNSNFAVSLRDALQSLQRSKTWNGFVDVPAAALTAESAPEYLSGLQSKHVVVRESAGSYDQLVASYKSIKNISSGIFVSALPANEANSLAKIVFLG